MGTNNLMRTNGNWLYNFNKSYNLMIGAGENPDIKMK